MLNFGEIEMKSCLKGRVVSVAAADGESLEALKTAFERGAEGALLFGCGKSVSAAADSAGIAGKVQTVHAESPKEAALKAAEAVSRREADILMKGAVNSSDFLRAVLDRDVGLRTGKRLSHITALELPTEGRLIFCTDGGMNVAPDLKAKKEILRNALEAMSNLGYGHVNVAAVAANERPETNMPAATDAWALAESWRSGEFDGMPCGCTVEGPIAVDAAFSAEVARMKGIESVITEKVDLFLMPNVECGNIFVKTLIYCAGARTAGFVAGAAAPVVMASRAACAETKYLSLALACAASS